MIPSRKMLIWKFITSTLVMGVFYFLLHLIVPPAENVYAYYIIIVALGSIIGYVFFFRKAILDADFHGDGKYYMPHLYFIATCYTTFAFLCGAFYYKSTEKNPNFFLIFGGALLGIYLLLIGMCWIMVKTGDTDWKLNEGD